MIRTQVQLTADQVARLQELSAQASKSVSHMVREAVDQYLSRGARAQVRALEDVVGRYTPSDAPELNEHDRVWAESVR